MRQASTFVSSALQHSKEALDEAVRARQSTKMASILDRPLDSANHPTKMKLHARDSPTRGDAVKMMLRTAAVDPPSMLRKPGFMSARTEASFAAAASLGNDRCLPTGTGSTTVTRRRLVEPIDSRNPRVGRGMAKIYNGEIHAIRCIVYTMHLQARGLDLFLI
jgi:hypothetical protein